MGWVNEAGSQLLREGQSRHLQWQGSLLERTHLCGQPHIGRYWTPSRMVLQLCGGYFHRSSHTLCSAAVYGGAVAGSGRISVWALGCEELLQIQVGSSTPCNSCKWPSHHIICFNFQYLMRLRISLGGLFVWCGLLLNRKSGKF